MQPQKETWFNDTPLTIAAHWRHPITGADITQANVTAIKRHVTLNGVAISGHANQALSVEDTVFDTLQLPSTWKRDKTGFNFRYTIAGTAFPDAGEEYQLEIVATLSDATQIVDVWLITTATRYAS